VRRTQGFRCKSQSGEGLKPNSIPRPYDSAEGVGRHFHDVLKSPPELHSDLVRQAEQCYSHKSINILYPRIIRFTNENISPYYDRAIAQTVAGFQPWRPGVRSKIRSYIICDGQSSTGADFLRVLRFPLSILIPPNAPYSSMIRSYSFDTVTCSVVCATKMAGSSLDNLIY
jgi:hypothetical protein